MRSATELGVSTRVLNSAAGRNYSALTIVSGVDGDELGGVVACEGGVWR